jgi:hypothetical protein
MYTQVKSHEKELQQQSVHGVENPKPEFTPTERRWLATTILHYINGISETTEFAEHKHKICYQLLGKLIDAR